LELRRFGLSPGTALDNELLQLAVYHLTLIMESVNRACREMIQSIDISVAFHVPFPLSGHKMYRFADILSAVSEKYIFRRFRNAGIWQYFEHILIPF
jgi:hypothetical protein